MKAFYANFYFGRTAPELADLRTGWWAYRSNENGVWYLMIPFNGNLHEGLARQ